MKLFRILILSLLVVSCASIRVNYDYDVKTNFNTYKTYNYYSDLDTGLSELDTKRLLDVLDSHLLSKELYLSETPDFFINITSSEYVNQSGNSVGVGIGGSGRNIGGGISIGLPIGRAKINRQIQIDFIDEGAIGLFWKAISESAFNPNALPEKREAKLRMIVEKVMSQYPPEH